MKMTLSKVLTAAFALATSATIAATMTVEGVRLEYRVDPSSGLVLLGDGTNVAVSVVEPLAELRVPIPATFEGISSNALNVFTSENVGCIEFFGRPPSRVDAGALPDPACSWIYYPREYAAQWEKEMEVYGEGEDACGFWRGIFAMKSPYVRTWDDLKAAAAEPDACVILLTNICQWANNCLNAELSVTNRLEIDLNGHDIELCNRLATVSAGGELTLCNSSRGIGGTIRGATGGNGAIVQVSDGNSRIVGDGVTFSNGRATANNGYWSGGAVSIDGDSGGRFTDCAFVNCTANNDGGAIWSGGQLELRRCVLADNTARAGGAIYACAELTLADCSVVTNGSSGTGLQGPGSAIYLSGGRLILSGCEISGNRRLGASNGSAVYLHAYKSCGITNCVITGIAGYSTLRANTYSAKISFAGDLIDKQPQYDDNIAGRPWAADGCEIFEHNGIFSAVRTGTLKITSDGKIAAGVFLFDPSDARYGGTFLLDPDARVVALGTEPESYEVRIASSGLRQAIIDGVTYTYRIIDGEAYLGDGTNPAVSGSDTRVVIPAKLDAFDVVGIGANAFAALPSGTVFAFAGLPPKSVVAGAFPTGASVSCSTSVAGEWAKVVVDGMWQGLTVLEPLWMTWQEVQTSLARGDDVVLGQNFTIGSGDRVDVSGAVSSTLDLNGHTITLVGYALLRVTDGACVTVKDRVGTGRVIGTEQTYTSDIITVLGGGTVNIAGGNFGPFMFMCGDCLFHAYSGGCVRMTDGTVSGCRNTDMAWQSKSGLIARVEDGAFEFVGGTMTSNVSENPVHRLFKADQSGRISFVGGTLTGNSVPADGFIVAGSTAAASIEFVGTVVQGNTCGGSPVAVQFGTSATVSVRGGVFDVTPEKLARGLAAKVVNGLTVVGREGTMAVSGGNLLTAGEFGFDPLSDDVVATGVTMKEGFKSAPVPGETGVWRLQAECVVPCYTSDELSANVLAGNEVSSKIPTEGVESGRMPSGFVYRAAVLDDQGKPATNAVKVTLRLYAGETDGIPLWTGSKANVQPKSEGVIQFWVDDDLMTPGSGSNRLADVFGLGLGVYLGVSFDDGEECSPRRNLVATPLTTRSSVAAAFDAEASVTYLQAPTGTLTCARLDLTGGGIVNTFKIEATNVAYSVTAMDVGGFTLYRHADNQILAPTDGEWVTGSFAKGHVFVSNAPVSGLLTIQSDDGDTVPMLVVPVPAGGTFAWPSTPFAGRYRFTAFGSDK